MRMYYIVYVFLFVRDHWFLVLLALSNKHKVACISILIIMYIFIQQFYMNARFP